ncbi:GlmL-related ornithine degradation protein [Alkaliphilus serpentinus]|uniref:DNA mismatch repair protein MutL n=1 Tax=Alkaliphilus serpentinus TaxID=1482731 RepID=A0A833HMM3_9FIRM|nr:GlmL-related ornithine degradation protein [Alkaliphilus serpentinus]KAB3527649.1 DNA mismatch repair protein MutL [Alkaliphilus serpentinus]
MKINVLVAEIGSTTTVVNGFQDIHSSCPKFLGQGQAPTSVAAGDVNIGLKAAIDDLAKNLGVEELQYDEMLATSSAAGGLKMTVHGLVYDMTVRAAKEAALGAGAIIHQVTAGRLKRTDLKRIQEIKPNIILIAGGVDYGERDTAIYNAEKIAELNLRIPVIYAGNVENQEEIKEIFQDTEVKLYLVENVYPKIDQLNIEPTRRVIQDVFEEHIIHAPGMTKVRNLVNGPIIPTPGAVMEASKLLKEKLGDLITFDVGGATTDLHSVTEGSEEISRILISPEPIAKRTVEGDLGVYVNMLNIVERIGKEKLKEELSTDIEELIENHEPIPKTPVQKKFVEVLTREAVLSALDRHVGKIRHLYGPGGKTTIAEGKDLSSVKYIVGTGGALTRLPRGVEILKEATLKNLQNKLNPTEDAVVLVDHDYIMASLGVLSKRYPEAALLLMMESLRLKE